MPRLFYSSFSFGILKDDKTVSVIRANSLIERGRLDAESMCHVKEKKKVYEGVIMSYGKILSEV